MLLRLLRLLCLLPATHCLQLLAMLLVHTAGLLLLLWACLLHFTTTINDRCCTLDCCLRCSQQRWGLVLRRQEPCSQPRCQ